MLQRASVFEIFLIFSLMHVSVLCRGNTGLVFKYLSVFKDTRMALGVHETDLNLTKAYTI